MMECPVCSFKTADIEALEDHVDLCLVAACRPLPPSIKPPPPSFASTSSPPSHVSIDSDDDLLQDEDDPNERYSKPSSAPSSASPAAPLPPCGILPRIPIPTLAPVYPRDGSGEEEGRAAKRRKTDDEVKELSASSTSKPTRSLTSALSSSHGKVIHPKPKRSLFDLTQSQSSQGSAYEEVKEEVKDQAVKPSHEGKKEVKVEQRDVTLTGSSRGGRGSAEGMLQVIEIDECDLSQSSAEGEVQEEVKEQRDGRRVPSPHQSSSSSSDVAGRSHSFVRQFKPFDDVDVAYLDDDVQLQLMDDMDEEQWLMGHVDWFDAALHTATSQLKRIIQEATFSSIASQSPSSLSSSSASTSSLTSILASLASAHQDSLSSQRSHYAQRYASLALRSAEVRKRAKAQVLSMKEDVERRLAVMNGVMLEHDKRHQRELEEELTRIRVEEWQKRDEEMMALEKAKRSQQEQWSVERIEVEEHFNRRLEKVQQEQATLQAKLKESSSIVLDEEKAALDTDTFARIQLTPSKHWEGLTGQEFHFRLAESQFLRMCGNRLSGQYRVKMVELIVNPTLRRRYDAFVTEERRKSGGVLRPPEHLTFHGTSTAAIEKIIVEGFRIGGVDTPIATAAALGQGIYSSEDPMFASGYIKDGRTQLLFSRVCPSSDSVIMKGPDGVIQQLVVKNRDQILPLYLVHFVNGSAEDRAAVMGSAAYFNPMMAMLGSYRPGRGQQTARRGKRRARPSSSARGGQSPPLIPPVPPSLPQGYPFFSGSGGAAAGGGAVVPGPIPFPSAMTPQQRLMHMIALGQLGQGMGPSGLVPASSP